MVTDIKIDKHRENLKRLNRSCTGQFDSLWLASWADECVSLRSRRTVGGSAGSHTVPAEMAYWVWIICYHGGDMGCGFCKYDITTADMDSLKVQKDIKFGIQVQKHYIWEYLQVD